MPPTPSLLSALLEPLYLTASASTTSTSTPLTRIPSFLYGCAWKKDNTSPLVTTALAHGFRGIDVAAQPKHYREDLAGHGIRRAIRSGKVKRRDLFVQTKFTSIDGQDKGTEPYDARASVAEQVRQSVKGSLKNLRPWDDKEVEEEGGAEGGAGDGAAAAEAGAEGYDKESYIDALVLHSPLRTLDQTLEAWHTLEEFVPSGQIRHLGISNTDLRTLSDLYDDPDIKIKPTIVQNRFTRDTDYDVEMRQYCRERGIVYQSFWTLSANQHLLRHPSVEMLVKAVGGGVGQQSVDMRGGQGHGMGPSGINKNVHSGMMGTISNEVALYALVMGLRGLVVLNGTTREETMRGDLDGIEQIGRWIRGEVDGNASGNVNETEAREEGGNMDLWEDIMKGFRDAIGDTNEQVMPAEGMDNKKHLPRHEYKNM